MGKPNRKSNNNLKEIALMKFIQKENKSKSIIKTEINSEKSNKTPNKTHKPKPSPKPNSNYSSKLAKPNGLFYYQQ